MRAPKLRGLKLTGLKLTGLKLTGLKLRGLKLTGLKLTGLKLTGLKLTGLKLTGALVLVVHLTLSACASAPARLELSPQGRARVEAISLGVSTAQTGSKGSESSESEAQPTVSVNPTISLVLEGLGRCDERFLSALSAQLKGEVSVALSARDLKRPPRELNVSAYLQRLLTARHHLMLRLEDDAARVELTDEQLDAKNTELSAALEPLIGELPPLLSDLWLPSEAWWRELRRALSAPTLPELTLPQRWLAVEPTQALNETRQGSLSALSELEGAIIRLSPQARCALLASAPPSAPTAPRSLFEQLTTAQLKLSPLNLRFEQALKAREHPRLMLTKREAISEGCATLFQVPTENSQPPTQQAPRWSLIIAPLPRSASAPQRYLTLPLPHDSTQGQPPHWDNSPALVNLWARRGMWRGAARCVQTLSEREALPPLSPFLSAQAAERTGEGAQHQQLERALSAQAVELKEAEVRTRFSLGLARPLSAQGDADLPSHNQLLRREDALQLPLALRGLLAEQAPQEAYVRHVSELEGLMALYGATGELRALTLWSARPLIPYLLLAELTGERAFLSLAFDERHSVGPLLMLPSERAWRASTAPQGAWGERARYPLAPPHGAQAGSRHVALYERAPAAPKPRLYVWLSQRNRALQALSSSLSELTSEFGQRAKLKKALSALKESATSGVGPLWRLSAPRLGEQRLRELPPSGERGVSESSEGW